ncbi:hypothetical protein ACOMHN_053298 [Nucella lapillus]
MNECGFEALDTPALMLVACVLNLPDRMRAFVVLAVLLLVETVLVIDDFGADFETAFNNQAQIDEGIGAVGALVSETKNNTAAALGQVDAVLTGQTAIKKLAGKEGAETRRAVKGLITATADEFETIASNQAAILAKIRQGRSKAVKSFQALFASQGQSQSQLGALVQAIEDASAANLDGQAKITNAVQDSRQEIQNDLAKVFSRQGTILKSLDNSQASVEKRIDAVFGRQQVIIQSIRASQGVVQSDLNGLKKEQGRTQNTVRQAQSAIRTEIGVVTKLESVTQHILVKCKNDCDLRRVVDGIFHIKKQVVSIENNLLREVRGVSSSEVKTQNALAGAEANILRELDANSDDTLHELNAFGELLHHLLADCENDIKTLNKDVIIVGNAQDHIEHALKQIHQDLDRLSFPNVDFGKSGFRKFH